MQKAYFQDSSRKDKGVLDSTAAHFAYLDSNFEPSSDIEANWCSISDYLLF